MSSLLAPRPAVKTTTRYSFRQNRQNPAFGVGLYPQKGRKLPIGPTAADREWAAAMLNRDETGITEDEADRLDARTMPATEYQALAADLADVMQLSQVGCEESFADDYLAAIEPPAHHVVRASDGIALAVVLDDEDGSDLSRAADRTLAVLAAEGPLPHAAWVARCGRHVFLLDRDTDRRELAFQSRTPISAEVLEVAFGFKLPRE